MESFEVTQVRRELAALGFAVEGMEPKELEKLQKEVNDRNLKDLVESGPQKSDERMALEKDTAQSLGYAAEAETRRLKAFKESGRKISDKAWEALCRLIGPAFGHSLVWATAAVLITYIIAVLRK